MVAEDTQLVALGIKDIERVLGKSLPLAIARNKVKQLLKDTGLY